MTKEERRYDNWSTVKYLKTREGIWPYVSAQAFRFWLRDTLQQVAGWTPSPIYREDKIAYTDANPILYAEDDLFGYMRAPGGSNEVQAAWAQAGLTDQERDGKKFVTLTRVSPFKVSTLLSIAPLRELAFDYGTMSRGESDPVPHVHEFYRTTLLGLFSIDLRSLGRFYHIDRTGFRHLDAPRIALAGEKGLTSYDNDRAYELPLDARKARLSQLLEGLCRISGGAKQALHYTDVAPKLILLGIARGGNHLFGNALAASREGTPKIQAHALTEIAQVFQADLLSPFYAGLAQGYLDDQRADLQTAVQPSPVVHPVQAIRNLQADLESQAEKWLA
jgi:CRISPR-associated protein Cst2